MSVGSLHLKPAPLVLLALLSAARPAAADPPAPLVLADGGRSEYRIVVSRDASPSERHAAEELRHFLREISGAEIPVADDKAAAAAREILVGRSARLDALRLPIDWTKLGDEGFTLRTAGPALVIAGGRLRGTMYGVYALLEDHLGCRWYSATVSRIPKRARVEIAPFEDTQVPAFESREAGFFVATDPDWAARNRQNGHDARLDDARGGRVVYLPFVHSFDRLVSPKKYFDEHPEYFGENAGKRVPRNQPCLTNPDVLQLVKEKVRGWIQDKPEAAILSVSQNDWGDPCRCKRCRTLDEAEGSPMGSLLTFVNAVADDVAAAHPRIAIDTLAYTYSRRPPKTVRPRKNVIVRLCDIECCFSHALDACDSPQNRAFVGDLKAWAAIHDRIYIWDYMTNFHAYLAPYPNLDALTGNLKFFARNHVKGVYAQGNYQSPGEFSELRAWLLAKLMWNPDADAKALLDDFLGGYYGKGAAGVKAYIDLLHKKGREENLHLNKTPKMSSPHLDPDILRKADAILEEAERAAEDDDVKFRVRTARVPVWFALADRLPEGDPERKRFEARWVEVARRWGVTHTHEGSADFEKRHRP